MIPKVKFDITLLVFLFFFVPLWLSVLCFLWLSALCFLWLKCFLHFLTDISRRLNNMNARLAQRLHLLGGSSLPTGDDCARVSHATSWRRRLTCDERYDRLRHILFRERCGLFFRAT